MGEQESQGGCNTHGPFEICGHTTETCPDNSEAVETSAEEVAIPEVIAAKKPAKEKHIGGQRRRTRLKEMYKARR